MILLSIIMERLEVQSAQLDRLEAKLDQEAEERRELSKKIDTLLKRWMAGVDLPDETAERSGTPDQVGSDGRRCPVVAGHDGAKPMRAFAEYVHVPEKAAEILAKLHKWIDERQRVKAILYIKAAMDARVLERVPFVAADAEYPGRLGSKSLYYAYISEPNAFTEDDLEELRRAKAALEEIAGRGRQ